MCCGQPVLGSVPSAGSLKGLVLKIFISRHILLCLWGKPVPSWLRERGLLCGLTPAGCCGVRSVQQRAASALPCPCRATRGRHGRVLPPPSGWESWHSGAGQQCLGCGSAASVAARATVSLVLVFPVSTWVCWLLRTGCCQDPGEALGSPAECPLPPERAPCARPCCRSPCGAGPWGPSMPRCISKPVHRSVWKCELWLLGLGI